MALEAGVAELLSQPIAVLKCNFDLRFRRQRCGSCLSTRYEKARLCGCMARAASKRERQGLSAKDWELLATASFNGHHPVCCLIPPLIDSRDRIRVVLLQRLTEADDLRS